MRCQSSGHDVPFCLYVTTGLVQCTVEYWWGALTRLVARAERIELSVLGMKEVRPRLRPWRRNSARSRGCRPGCMRRWKHAARQDPHPPRLVRPGTAPIARAAIRPIPNGPLIPGRAPPGSTPRADSLLWPALAREAKTPRIRAPRTDESPDKSSILDRPLAPLTTHRSNRTLPPSEKGRLKFLYLLYLSVTDSQNAMTGFPFFASHPEGDGERDGEDDDLQHVVLRHGVDDGCRDGVKQNLVPRLRFGGDLGLRGRGREVHAVPGA